MQELNPGKTWQQGHSRQQEGIFHQVGRHEIPKLELEHWDCEVDPVCVNIIICNCLWVCEIVWEFVTKKTTYLYSALKRKRLGNKQSCYCNEILYTKWITGKVGGRDPGRSRSVVVKQLRAGQRLVSVNPTSNYHYLEEGESFRWERLGKLKDLQSGPGKCWWLEKVTVTLSQIFWRWGIWIFSLAPVPLQKNTPRTHDAISPASKVAGVCFFWFNGFWTR